MFTESVEDEDEVLTALSDELGGFVEYVGGPEHAHVLLSPLENLASIEEPLVREKVRLNTEHRHVRQLISLSGRRVTQQDLRATQRATSRAVLYSSDFPSLQSRLVHIQDLGHWSLHNTVSKVGSRVANQASPAVRTIGPR